MNIEIMFYEPLDSTGLFPQLTIISGLEFGRISKVCKANLLRFLVVLNFSALVDPGNLKFETRITRIEQKKHANRFHPKTKNLIPKT